MRGAGALADRARAGGGERVRQAERNEAEGWAAREWVGRGWTEREVWAELVWRGLGRSVGELGRGKKRRGEMGRTGLG